MDRWFPFVLFSFLLGSCYAPEPTPPASPSPQPLPVEAPPAPDSTEKPLLYTNERMGLEVFARPDSNSEVLGVIGFGEEIEGETTGDWLAIPVEDEGTAYVRLSSLTEEILLTEAEWYAVDSGEALADWMQFSSIDKSTFARRIPADQDLFSTPIPIEIEQSEALQVYLEGKPGEEAEYASQYDALGFVRNWNAVLFREDPFDGAGAFPLIHAETGEILTSFPFRPMLAAGTDVILCMGKDAYSGPDGAHQLYVYVRTDRPGAYALRQTFPVTHWRVDDFGWTENGALVLAVIPIIHYTTFPDHPNYARVQVF